MRLRTRCLGVAGLLIASAFVRPELAAMASDAVAPVLVLDFTSLDGRLKGNGWLVPGVSGQALQLDGIAAHVIRSTTRQSFNSRAARPAGSSLVSATADRSVST